MFNMNYPWLIKYVQQSQCYTSCMKINGVPLLPPVITEECRKEMQYYKLLAKEVEKRILFLKPNLSGSSSDKDQNSSKIQPNEEVCDTSSYKSRIEEDTISSTQSQLNSSENRNFAPNINKDAVTLNVTILNTSPNSSVQEYRADIRYNNNNLSDHSNKNYNHCEPLADVPERDYNCAENKQGVKLDHHNHDLSDNPSKKLSDEKLNLKFNSPTSTLDVTINDIPTSLSSKSFTGSLNDIHSECVKETKRPKLIRQRSYTLLRPSPQLQAHLEVQSRCKGIEIASISMSDSISNVGSSVKKRKSWDLESAKVKWSSMALELKDKNISKTRNYIDKSKKAIQNNRSRPVSSNRKPVTMSPKNTPKSEPVRESRPKSRSPVRREIVQQSPTKQHCIKEAPKTLLSKDTPLSKPITTIVAKVDDPASKVRELYETIQKQQLLQMANLVEKQKREQLMLQQVFEEQNNLLFKQIKSLCPKSALGIKQFDITHDFEDRGPVSLSQLLNKSPIEKKALCTPASMLNDTKTFIKQYDEVLQKSRDLSSSLKEYVKSQNVNGGKNQSVVKYRKSNSPHGNGATARKLNYDTSGSTERDFEPTLTDRTNDTFADLNVTFSTDNSDDYIRNKTVINQMVENEHVHVHRTLALTPANSFSTNSYTKIAARPQITKNSPRNVSQPEKSHALRLEPTPRELAAANVITAYARGFLVRRLMRTERVQTIVQTIRDALLCALQLHQERDGISGADVDLHRRLIQQITAACYSLHDTFVNSTPAERCAVIAADRSRRKLVANRTPPLTRQNKTDV